jgi:N6-adenosine-specific RNA methylase IME4
MRADIEALMPGPYVELFARESAPGWAAWGNETEKFNSPLLAA